MNGVIIYDNSIGRVPVAPHASGFTVGGETASGDDDLLVSLQITPSRSDIIDLQRIHGLVSPARIAAYLGSSTASDVGVDLAPRIALCLSEAGQAKVIAHWSQVCPGGVNICGTSVVACAKVWAKSLERIIVHQAWVVGTNLALLCSPAGYLSIVLGHTVRVSVDGCGRGIASCCRKSTANTVLCVNNGHAVIPESD